MKTKALAVAILACALLSGCGLYPSGNSVVPTPSPDNINPSPVPSDPDGIAKKASDALIKDKVPAAECRLMWATFAAMATAVENGEFDSQKVTDMLEVWTKTIKQWGWEVGRYKDFSDVVETELKKIGEDANLDVSGVRSKIVTNFRLLAEGCRVASAGK